MDQIRIDNLEVYAYHGVFPEENEKGQLFYVNMVLYGELREAAQEDDLYLSTNYGEVCQFVTELMQEKTYKLIETVAESVAREVLRSFPLVQAVDVEIRKPQAPIELPFESVSVKIHRGWHRVYVAMGSNMGDKEAYLTEAVEKLQEKEDIGVVNVSTLITTEPYGGVEQDVFLNGVMELRTLLTPNELLNVLQGIEIEANRERTIHWGPRTLDLDIIFYDKLVMENYSLIIPHVDMENRDFVLKPMVELNPNFRHPILQKTMQQLLNELTAKKLS